MLLRAPRRLLLVGAVILGLTALPSVAVTPPAVGTSTAVLADVTGLAAGTVRAVEQGLAPGTRLVGVTWTGAAPGVAVRWRVAGAWTAWTAAESDAGRPEAAERAGAVAGTEPLWRPTGADRVQVRLTGTGAGTLARVLAVGDGTVPAVALGTARAEAAVSKPVLGRVYSRGDWGADERMRKGSPSYARRVEAVVVHHTAQANDYAAGDVPAMIRADYSYHVRTRGWSDLGYNLLVDRFGRVWEGRYGGVGRPVVGAHAQGFNTSTLGVAYLGDSDRAAAPQAALDALARVAAFAGTTYGWSPTSTVVLTSGGSPRYRSGTAVRLPRVQGHRDTGQTSCPGASLYGRLDPVRRAALALQRPVPRFGRVQLTGASPVVAPHPMTLRSDTTEAVNWR